MAALSGIRVIDLTQFEAGTTCTLALAWFGADVIKVERPSTGDQARQATTDIPGMDSFYFLVLNANKRSVTLDLKTPRGKEIVLRLLENADVFVENFAPGTIERLGLDYETVRARNPRIVYAQIKGFDPDGPFADYLSFDPVGQATGGIVSLTGYPDGPPLRPGVNIADTGSGTHLALGILAALFQRESTGEGQRVRVSMQESVINYSRVAFHRQLMSGEAVERWGNQLPLHTAPAGLYKCKGDGPNDYVMIYASRATNDHWRALLRIVGREDLEEDDRFRNSAERWRFNDEIDGIVSSWTIQHDKLEVMRILGDAHVPAGAVLDTNELINDPFLRKGDAFVEVEHGTRGVVTIPGWCVKLTESAVRATAAPLLGEHTDAVLTELAGLESEELAALRGEGVI